MIAYFEYNGKKSTDFNLLMDPEFELSGPEADVTFEEIDGSDGDYVIDNERFKSVTRSIPVSLEPVPGLSVVEAAGDISNWLNQDKGWKDLYLSDNPEFVYRAIYTEAFNLNKSITEYSRAIIGFHLKPYKFYRSSLQEVELTNGQRITNIGTRPSSPLIRMLGSGDMSITIGGQTVRFTGVQDGIVLDVLKDTPEDLRGRPAWTNTHDYPFPKIPIGDSQISWTGANQVFIAPRWEELLP